MFSMSFGWRDIGIRLWQTRVISIGSTWARPNPGFRDRFLRQHVGVHASPCFGPTGPDQFGPARQSASRIEPEQHRLKNGITEVTPRCMYLCPRLLLVFATVFIAGTTGRSADRPNILFILSDDMGYGDLGFTGSKHLQTPHLDALATSGVFCSQGYVTSPVCSPSRAGLITGRDLPDAPRTTGTRTRRTHPGRSSAVSRIRHRAHRQMASWTRAWFPSAGTGLRLFLRNVDRQPWLLPRSEEEQTGTKWRAVDEILQSLPDRLFLG